jgi:hypothetical protein
MYPGPRHHHLKEDAMERIWFEAYLYVRRPGSPGVPDHRVQVDARITFSVPPEPPAAVGGHAAGRLRVLAGRETARREADKRLRELGLGTAMDLPGAEVAIDVMLL